MVRGLVLPLGPLRGVFHHRTLFRQPVTYLVGQSKLLGLTQLLTGFHQQLDEGRGGQVFFGALLYFLEVKTQDAA